MVSGPKAAGGRRLPNQFAAPTAICMPVLANGFRAGNGKRSIFDRDGVAIIVDARADDYRTSPWAMPATASPVACDAHRRAQSAAQKTALTQRPAGGGKPGTAMILRTHGIGKAAIAGPADLIEADALRHALTALAKRPAIPAPCANRA